MFLLHIEKNKIKETNLLQITHVQNVSKKIKKQIFFFKKLKKVGGIKKLNFLILKTDVFKPLPPESHDTIKYIIGITINHRNTIIYLSDVKGTIKFFCSTGTLKMNRKQKQKKVPILIKLMKIIIPKISIIPEKDRIALHLKNFNKHLSFFTLHFLYKHREIYMLKINNTEPHNGCRPRKPKRKRKQRLNFG